MRYPYSQVRAENKTYCMVGVSGFNETIQIRLSVDETEWIPADECKLELTPLFAITDEHAIEVAKIARPYITDYNHLLNIGWGIISVIKDGYILPELGFKSITAILRKLCEFGYDCDNAISEGWAVDKTSPKK